MFRTSLRDAFTLAEREAPGQSFRSLWMVNGAGAEVSGVDLDSNLQLTDRLSLRGGFSVQTAVWDQPESQFGERNFFRTPKSYGFLGCDWDLPGGIQLSGTADYTGAMLAPHYAGYIEPDRLEHTPRFLVFNFVASKIFAPSQGAKMRLYFNMQNIGDSYQRGLDEGPQRDSSYMYGPAEMRRAVTGLTLEF